MSFMANLVAGYPNSMRPHKKSAVAHEIGLGFTFSLKLAVGSDLAFVDGRAGVTALCGVYQTSRTAQIFRFGLGLMRNLRRKTT